MKIIGAKELRLHLDEVLDRVLSGEEIVVKHRFKGPVRLVAQHTQPRRGSSAAIAKTLEHLRPELAKHKSTLDPHKSIKELYDESLRSSKKYGKYFND